MSYRTHKRRPTSIATDHIFKSQIANTYVAADGQVLQSSMVKNGSPSKRQLTGSISTVRFSLPYPDSDSEAEISKDIEQDWVNITDDDEEQDALNLENDEPFQRTDSYFSHNRSRSDNSSIHLQTESIFNQKTHNKTASIAESMVELLSTSPNRSKLFLKPNSELNSRSIPVPMELSLPPLISPQNSHKTRPRSLVFNGTDYEPLGLSLLDKSKSFSNTPKKLFEETEAPKKQANHPNNLISSNYNGKISIPDLSKPISKNTLPSKPETLDNEKEIENPSPAAKRQNNMLNKEFSFPNVPSSNFDKFKDLPDIPVSTAHQDSEVATGLKLFSPDGLLGSPKRTAFRFDEKNQRHIRKPINFHQRTSSQIVSLDQFQYQTHEKHQNEKLDRLHLSHTQQENLNSQAVSSSKSSEIPTTSEHNSSSAFHFNNNPSSNYYDVVTGLKDISCTQRNVSLQSTSSSQYSTQDSIQDSIQDSVQIPVQDSISESIQTSDCLSTIDGDESIDDISKQLHDLGLTILNPSYSFVVNNASEEPEADTSLTILGSNPSISDVESLVTQPEELHVLEKADQSEISIEEISHSSETQTESELHNTQDKQFQDQLSYHNQQYYKVFQDDAAEIDNIRSSTTATITKSIESPLLSQSSYESAFSQPFSNVSSVTNATSFMDSNSEIIDLTRDEYNPPHEFVPLKQNNKDIFKCIFSKTSNGDFHETIIIDDDDDEVKNNNASFTHNKLRRNGNCNRRPKSYQGNIAFSKSDRAFSNFSFETVASEVQLHYKPSTDSTSNSRKSFPLSQYRDSNQGGRYNTNDVIALCDTTMMNTQNVIEDLRRQRTLLINKHHEVLRQKKLEEKRLKEIRQRQADLSNLCLRVHEGPRMTIQNLAQKQPFHTRSKSFDLHTLLMNPCDI